MHLRVFPSAASRTITTTALAVVALVSLLPANSRVDATPRYQTDGGVVPILAGDAASSATPAAPTPVAPSDTEQKRAPTSTIPKNRVLVLTGRGYGHGRGLGQWGAYGYAKDFGWSYARMLDHYYGGTVPGHVSPKSAIGVRLQWLDGKSLIVYQPKGRLYTAPEGQTGFTLPPGLAEAQPSVLPDLGNLSSTSSPVPVQVANTIPVKASATLAVPKDLAPVGATDAPPILTASPAAIRIELVKGGFVISDGPTCAGPWSVRPGTLPVNSLTLTAGPTEANASADDPDTMLHICSGKQRRVYRGDLLAVNGQPKQATVNIVGLDAYLRGVVPREIAAKWGDVAPEAVKAQAVAARSYAAAEKRTGFSNTCDTISCQVYNGRGIYDGTKFTAYEDPRTDRAIAETANEVRVNPVNGKPIRTEFSASTGGFTAPGEFPPVEDKGDATTANPNNGWVVRLASTHFDGKLGALIKATVTKRNGLGDDGGRVVEVTMTFTNGSKTMTGSELMSTYHLRSTWFDTQVVADGSETPLEQADPAAALTGDAGDVVSARATVPPKTNSGESDAVTAPVPTSAKRSSRKTTKPRRTKTTIATVVAAAGTPVNTIEGGAAVGAPTTKQAKVTTGTKSRRPKRTKTTRNSG